MTQIKSFTTKYDGKSNVLKNLVGISDPTQTRLIDKKPDINLNTVAIWDTGATNSAITASLAAKLSLQPIGMTNVCHGGGIQKRNTYIVDIWLPNKVTFLSVRVTELDLTGADVLIGMDIISSGDFAVSNFGNKTIFTFRFPSVETTDYTKQKINSQTKLDKPKKGKGKNKGQFKY